MCLAEPENPRVLANPLIIRSRSWGYLRVWPRLPARGHAEGDAVGKALDREGLRPVRAERDALGIHLQRVGEIDELLADEPVRIALGHDPVTPAGLGVPVQQGRRSDGQSRFISTDSRSAWARSALDSGSHTNPKPSDRSSMMKSCWPGS